MLPNNIFVSLTLYPIHSISSVSSDNAALLQALPCLTTDEERSALALSPAYG